MATSEKDGVAINCLSNSNLAPAMARNMFSFDIVFGTGNTFGFFPLFHAI